MNTPEKSLDARKKGMGSHYAAAKGRRLATGTGAKIITEVIIPASILQKF